MMVKNHMAQTLKAATTFIEQGRILLFNIDRWKTGLNISFKFKFAFNFHRFKIDFQSVCMHTWIIQFLPLF